MGIYFDRDVALNAVLYVAGKLTGRHDKHKIFKILYFADREHLSRYGRSITRDVYIAMKYGPVPSKIDDMFKVVRGDCLPYNDAKNLREYFHFVSDCFIELDRKADMDYLSKSDVECLDYAIEKCKDKSFDERTDMSHDSAWQKKLNGIRKYLWKIF